MIVTSTYSPWLRDRLTREDWAHILRSGDGEVRFARGFGGSYIAEVIREGTMVSAADRRSPRAAFDAALRELRPEIVSVLRG